MLPGLRRALEPAPPPLPALRLGPGRAAGDRRPGTLWAATLVHRTPDPAFAPLVPFRAGLVTLEEGPRLMAHLSADAPIGARLRGAMEEVAGRPVPVFSPDPAFLSEDE